ncbi:hypothetical protein ASG37_02595 [Sphingomonas sp. Leaf407]|nr:hypothetical protein ASE97_02620 [Sphingomonas sp. Leaf42]KQT30049.1 hypothetical protein ASG37_02595 [Sphingomonas sp. Leaf407]
MGVARQATGAGRITMAETPVTVEPCDREAARRLREEIQRQIGPSSGLIAIEDDDFDVQLFARHRAASAPVVAAGPVDRLTIGTILARNFSRFIRMSATVSGSATRPATNCSSHSRERRSAIPAFDCIPKVRAKQSQTISWIE